MSGYISFKQSGGYAYQKKKQGTLIMLTENCESTHSCSGGCGACGGKKNGRTILIPANEKTELPLGTKVTVQYPEVNEFIGALIVFGIPVACALLSLVLWYLSAPGLVESGISILSAGASFVLGFIVVRCIDGIFRTRFPSHIIAADYSNLQSQTQQPEQDSNG